MNYTAPKGKTSAMVVLSGGQDSTTCLAWAKQNFDIVHAITFNYGQKHITELESAAKVAAIIGVDSHEFVTLPEGILLGTSPLINGSPVPEYGEGQEMPEGVATTFVPVRNQFFLTLAANRAFVLGCNTLITGVCETDYSGYPDCRRTFIDSLENTLNLGTFTGEDWLLGNISILTPLMYMSKAESVNFADPEIAYPALAYSHTAYDGSYPPKGTDAASILRAKGFEEAGVPDPLVLRAWKNGLMELPDTYNYASTEVNQAVSLLEEALGEKWYDL